MNLRDLRWITCGFSIKQASEYCYTSIRTYKRWEYTNHFPRWVPDILLMRAGFLDLAGFESKIYFIIYFTGIGSAASAYAQ